MLYGVIFLDRGARVLLVLCFIMVGAVAFMAGILFEEGQHKGDSPISSDSDTLNRKPAVDYSVDMGEDSGTDSARPPGAAPGHRIRGPVYYLYDDEITHGWVAWYYDVDAGQYFSEYDSWDPNAGATMIN